MANIAMLEGDFKQREETDITLGGIWKVLLLSLVTLGIYGMYTIYRLVQRRDMHFQRINRLTGDLINFLQEKGEETGEDVSQSIRKLEAIKRKLDDQAKERGAVLWLLICMFTGIGSFILYYFLMDDFLKHEKYEREFLDTLNPAAKQLGIITAPIKAERSIEERSFAMYLVLSIITLGIFGIYWFSVILNEPNRHFLEHARWEAVLSKSTIAQLESNKVKISLEEE